MSEASVPRVAYAHPVERAARRPWPIGIGLGIGLAVSLALWGGIAWIAVQLWM